MQHMNIITSVANEKVKALRALVKEKKARKLSCQFVAEGVNFISDMPIKAKEIFLRQGVSVDIEELAFSKSENVIFLSEKVFDSVADTKTPSGILAVMDNLEPKPISGDIVLVLDSVSDCGNLGTLIRTASAIGINDIVAINTVELYNPKVIRATMTGLFNVNYIEVDYDDLDAVLSGYQKIAMNMNGVHLSKFEPCSKVAIMLGKESTGLSDFVKNIADVTVSIEMKTDSVESLNVAMAGAIAMYTIKNKIIRS